jgi:hypothetical protein
MTRSATPHCALVRAVVAAAQVRSVSRLTVWFGSDEIAAHWEAGRADGKIVIPADPEVAAR